MKYRESLIVLGMLLASCSSKEEQPTEQKTDPNANQPKTYSSTRHYEDTAGRPGVQDSSLTSTSATVEAIDQEKRMITLRGPYGALMTFKVGDRVKNLQQIHTGDRVVVDYYQSLAIQVVKPGTSGDQHETIVDSADPGEKPAGGVIDRYTMTATIQQIDRSVPSVTLKDQNGNFHTVRVRHPERLSLVKVGDTLKITYTQAVIASVEPAPPGAD
jgi:hypothetical protein